MGSIEKRVKKRAQKQNIRNAVLTALKAGGIVGVALVAPNGPAAVAIYEEKPIVLSVAIQIGTREADRSRVGRNDQ